MKKIFLFFTSLLIAGSTLAQGGFGVDGALHPFGNYPIVLGSETLGVTYPVADLTALNAINPNFLLVGQLIWVIDQISFYQWDGSSWNVFSVGGTWGTITGTLSAQTDLQAALDAKQDLLGFTPEDVANKTATQSSSATTYPNWLGITNYAQPLLVSGTNIKTINSISILGSGDIVISGATPNPLTVNNSGAGDVSSFIFNGSVPRTLSYNSIGAQPTLVSGTNIKTINGATLLGSTNILLQTPLIAGTDYLTPTGSAAGLTSFPTLNQNTTGSAASLTTPRNIQGVAFDGTANINPINGTGFVKATGTTLSYDNSTYITGNQTITFTPTGDVTGTASGTTSLTPALTIGAGKVVNSMIAASTIDLTTKVTNILPVANGGTGTASPGIVAGTNVTVSGTWPNQTVNSTGGGGLASSNFVYNETPSGTINGSNVTFTIANTPTTGKYFLSKNGVVLNTTEYSISGTTITYTVAPTSTPYNDVLLINYMK